MADPRVTPLRNGVAATSLEGTVAADQFSDGVEQAVKTPFLDLTTEVGDTSLASQLLFGERFVVYGYDADSGKVWGQATADGYVGYVDPGGLADPGPHDGMVTTSFAPVYAAANIKSKPLFILPFGSHLPLARHDDAFFATLGGFIHGRNMTAPAGDLVDVASQFLGTPYLWGGRTPAGLDCSALIQLAVLAHGQSCPRDSDMQWCDLGEVLLEGADLRRNDMVFWQGHVGIMADAEMLLHANAHHMAVVSEPLSVVKDRIEVAGEGLFLGAKRLSD